jgi:hypothetical protein
MKSRRKRRRLPAMPVRIRGSVSGIAIVEHHRHEEFVRYFIRL